MCNNVNVIIYIVFFLLGCRTPPSFYVQYDNTNTSNASSTSSNFVQQYGKYKVLVLPAVYTIATPVNDYSGIVAVNNVSFDTAAPITSRDLFDSIQGNNIQKFTRTMKISSKQQQLCNVPIPITAQYTALSLVYAMKLKRYNMIDALLTCTQNIDYIDTDGKSALLYAIEDNNMSIIQQILQEYKQRELQIDNSQPLFLSIAQQNVSVISLLLDIGIAMNDYNESGNTPLIEASKLGNSEIINVLLAHNVDINYVNMKGQTALMMAARYKYFNILTALANAGANVNVVDNNGYSAIQYARINGANNAVAILQNY